AAVAGRAAAAPPNDVTLFLHTCVDHLGVGSIAVGAFHGRAVSVTGLTVNGETRRQLVYLRAYGSQVGFILGIVEHVSQQVGGELGFRFLEAASGHGRRTQTDAAGHKGLLRVIRDGVLVDRDVCFAQCDFSVLAGNPLGTQVYQHDVAFRAA